ncbi:MAG: RNA methyltransferase [Lachnospiraceae bacterium]|nr:RNA methyltransferase [Lachnospiraceae bacterium]
MANIIKITDLMAPELDIYARLNENQLLHYYEPDTGIFIAESPNVIIRALNAGYEPLSILLEEKEIESDAKKIIELCDNIPIFTAKLDVLTKLTGFQLTRGLLCAMYRKTLPSISDICKNAKRIVILENVMNPTNVGAIFRSAAALNMDAVLLTHGCADPLYRRASRVSMGTVFQIPWTYIGNDTKDWYESGMDMIKEQGFKTVAMALRKDSMNVDDPRLMSEEKLAIILGTEGDGLADSTINDCDYTVCIPMSHGVDSLNVAAASAVAFWQLGKR